MCKMIKYRKKSVQKPLHFVRYCFIMVAISLWGVCALGEVIAFVSGKGGTGKSALCAALATALAQSGKRVLCVDMDIGLRNLDVFLGLATDDVLSVADLCAGSYALSAVAPHPHFPTLYFVTAPTNGAFSQLPEQGFDAFLTRAQREFDFILLDGAAGLGDNFRFLCRRATLCLVPLLPDPASVRCAECCAQELEILGVKNARMILNRSYTELLKAMGMNVDDVMDAVGLPILGIVPADPAVSAAASRGIELLQYEKRGAAAACRRIAARLMGQKVPLADR